MRNDPTGNRLDSSPLSADPAPNPNSDPEFRRDPVSGWWVVVAPDRSQRPMVLEEAGQRDRIGVERSPCPFCPGQEQETPHEVFAIREPGTPPDGPGWRLRVVPNKFPAVRLHPNPPLVSARSGAEPASPSGEVGADEPPLFDRLPGVGRHEVVIESAEHLTNPALLPDDLFRAIFLVYRDRLVALSDDPTLRYAAVFKNVGTEAGASLGHGHSQIVATPLIPDLIARELRGADDHFRRTGQCLFCALLAHERVDGSRIVAESAGFVAVAAFAPRFAYEVWVLPKAHASRYECLTAAQVDDLAGLMKGLVRAIDRTLGEPAYNWFLHTSPLRSADLPFYHWHFEILPRSSRPAGFEWGTGCFVTAVTPETAAAALRAVWRS